MPQLRFSATRVVVEGGIVCLYGDLPKDDKCRIWSFSVNDSLADITATISDICRRYDKGDYSEPGRRQICGGGAWMLWRKRILN